MSGYLDWFDQYCNFCKKVTPHGRDDSCQENESAIIWCLICKKISDEGAKFIKVKRHIKNSSK